MIISLLVIVIVNVIIRLRVPTDSPQMDGLNEANLGLLIAYLAHLDLVFTAFWSILLFAKGRPHYSYFILKLKRHYYLRYNE